MVKEKNTEAERYFFSSLMMEYVPFFLLVSVIGWGWELLVYWCVHGFQGNLLDLAVTFRGMLHGPWVPIYGAGASLMVLMKRLFPLKMGCFFLINMAACGVLEYGTSVLLELVFHARWWDYTGQFLNVNGRICAVSLVFFSAAGLIVGWVVEPWFHGLVSKLPKRVQLTVSVAAAWLFFLDVSISVISPSMGAGVLIL